MLKFFLIFLSIKTFAFDRCSSELKSNYKAIISFLGKKDAIKLSSKELLEKEKEEKIEELLKVRKVSRESLEEALEYAVDFLSLGNIATIYNIDALVMAYESSPEVFEFIKKNKKNEQRYVYLQLFTALNIIEVLQVLEREEEVDILKNYLESLMKEVQKKNSKAHEMARQIQALREYISLTGKFSSKKSSVEFCEAVFRL